MQVKTWFNSGRTWPTEQKPPEAESPSKLTFKGVSDKQHAHTGYFEYRLGDDGRIYCRWDPSLPSHAFEVSCSNRRELPFRSFDAKAWALRRHVAKIKGPYKYRYDEKTSQVVCSVRDDLAGRGFVLRKGKLIEVPLAQASAWHLHDGQGGPKLPKGVRIAEIQVANEIIFARASDNEIYMYNPCLPYKCSVKWRKRYGYYDEGSLQIPARSRDWSAGISMQLKPWQRRGLEFINPWTDVDSYYGSPDYRIAQGITPTVGALSDDGTTIELWDTGLPTDRQRRFLTPERGLFIALKMAQAATYWFVLGYDQWGKLGLFGRQLNYEGIGSCIGMEHSCDPLPKEPAQQVSIHDLGEAVRGIPGKGWEGVASPHLHALAAITDEFSAHCIGEGQDAREIRIEGISPEGKIGYYRKTLKDADWHFVATEASQLKGRVLPSQIPYQAPDVTPHEYLQEQPAVGLDESTVQAVSLRDFHPFQTQSEPSVLRFRLASGAQVDLLFRTSDAWSPFERKEFEDVGLAQGVGVPKILVGTLEIPDEVLSSDDPEIQWLVTSLKPYDRIANLFEVIADKESVEIHTSGHVRHYRRGRGHEILPQMTLRVHRMAIGETLFEREANRLSTLPLFESSPDELRLVIAANQELERQVHRFSQDVARHAKKLKVRWKRLAFLLGLVSGFSALTRIRKREYVSALLDLLPRLISAHTRAFAQADKTSPGVTRALEQIQSNIRIAQLLLRDRGL